MTQSNDLDCGFPAPGEPARHLNNSDSYRSDLRLTCRPPNSPAGKSACVPVGAGAGPVRVRSFSLTSIACRGNPAREGATSRFSAPGVCGAGGTYRHRPRLDNNRRADPQRSRGAGVLARRTLPARPARDGRQSRRPQPKLPEKALTPHTVYAISDSCQVLGLCADCLATHTFVYRAGCW